MLVLPPLRKLILIYLSLDLSKRLEQVVISFRLHFDHFFERTDETRIT